jgi:hypothetical protein
MMSKTSSTDRLIGNDDKWKVKRLEREGECEREV